MTIDELNDFLERNLEIEWRQDEDGTLYLRHAEFDNPHEKLKIEPGALEKISVAQLKSLLVGGRNIEHITRITGYFSKVEGWNKGKQGELRDRQRVEVLCR